MSALYLYVGLRAALAVEGRFRDGDGSRLIMGLSGAVGYGASSLKRRGISTTSCLICRGF